MSDIKVICSDLFYTLVDPHAELEHLEYEALGASAQVWNNAFWRPEEADARGLGQITDPQQIMLRACAMLPVQVTNAQINAALDAHLARLHLALTQVDTTILNTLEVLKSRGYRLGLVSNADVMDKHAWDISPLAPFFDDVVFSCDVGLLKPDPAIYRLSLEHLGATPQEALFIGDGGSDELRGAKSLNMTTVCTQYLLKRSGKDGAAVRRNADHVINKFTSLRRLLK